MILLLCSGCRIRALRLEHVPLELSLEDFSLLIPLLAETHSRVSRTAPCDHGLVEPRPVA